MRIFHMADLHIGKILNGFSMIEDQKIVLEQTKEYIKKYKPDVLILAGDIYDRSIPSSVAIDVFSGFVSDVLMKLKTPIIAISGNHDGANLIEYGNKIFENLGFYIEGKLKNEIKKVVLQDEYGNVNFYMIPFSDYQIVRELYKNENVKSLDDAMECLLNSIKNFNDKERNILVTHSYVSSSSTIETTESEKPLVLGGKEYVRSSLFDKFDYVALGHLHKHQKVGKENIRYSGSMLKYSFSEENDEKGILMVDIGKKGEINYELLLLNSGKNMITKKGKLEDIINDFSNENDDDYIKVILTDENELIEPMNKLRKVYKNIMILEIDNNRGIYTNELSNKDRKNKTPIEIFEEFYKYNTNNDLSEKQKQIIITSIEDINKGE